MDWEFFCRYAFIGRSNCKIVEDEAGRADDFYRILKRIEYQSARIAQNPNFDLNGASTRNLMQEKSIDLMTAIVTYFNSALLYYSRDFFGERIGAATC